MKNLNLRVILALSVTLALALPVAFGQVAGSPEENGAKKLEKKADSKDVQTPAAGGGVVVFIDPVTGKIRQPEPGEIGELLKLRPTPAPSAVKPGTVIRGPGNAVGMVLDDSFHSFAVATKGPDGKLVTDCVTGAAAAAQKVAAGSTPPATAKKEALDEK